MSLHVGTAPTVKKWTWIGAAAGFVILIAGSLVYLFQPFEGGIDLRAIAWPMALLGIGLMGLAFVPNLAGRHFLSLVGTLLLLASLASWLFLPDPSSAEGQVGVAVPAGQAAATPAVSTLYESLIQEASQRHGVPADLIRAVIRAESNFNPNAKSDKGALGLMQVLPSTAEKYGITDLFDPVQNIEAGTRYLAEMLRRYGGNTELALAAYNSGPDTVDRWVVLRSPNFASIVGDLPDETQEYVPDVLEFQKQYASGTIRAREMEVARVRLLGEGAPSTDLTDLSKVPPSWRVLYYGPETAMVHFDDGTAGPITSWYGIKSGNIRRFSGPAGEEVVVRAYPPQ